jgi:hypothetical protein
VRVTAGRTAGPLHQIETCRPISTTASAAAS